MQNSEKEPQEMGADTDMNNKVYEVGYLLVPTIADEELGARYSALKDTLTSFGGMLVSDEMPRLIPLAYPMVKVIANVPNKFDTAYFGWCKFEMEAAKVLELKKKLDLATDMIRFLIIKTVRENTIATKKFGYKDMARRKPAKKEEGEAHVEINKEELDKEIDAMVEA